MLPSRRCRFSLLFAAERYCAQYSTGRCSTAHNCHNCLRALSGCRRRTLPRNLRTKLMPSSDRAKRRREASHGRKEMTSCSLRYLSTSLGTTTMTSQRTTTMTRKKKQLLWPWDDGLIKVGWFSVTAVCVDYSVSVCDQYRDRQTS